MSSTPTIPADVVLRPVTEAVLELTQCVCAQLADTGAGPVCWCAPYAGLDIAFDYCQDCGVSCGMGWVRLAGAAPYADFPVPTVDTRCVLPLAVQFEVGALRCIHVPDDGGPLSPDEMTQATIDQLADMWALRTAILCCGMPLALGTYQPVGPEGGCVGGFWSAYLPVDG